MLSQGDYTEISDPSALASDPLVSVHLFAYMHGPFIGRAIESIVEQERDFPMELIIGEDFSSDNTREVVLDYQRRHPDLIRVLIGERNVGPFENVARCMAATRGEFIAMIDGDDYWCDGTKLARQLAVFRRYPECSLVFHTAKYVDAVSGRQTRTSRQSWFSRILSTDEVILGDGGLIPTASILVRHAVARLQPTWCYDAPVGDYPLALYAASAGKIVCIDRIMSAYRVNVPHSWTKRHVPHLRQRIEYAHKIEAMFSGFDRDCGGRFNRSVRTMISKYFSDPLVRLDASREEKRSAYLEVSDRIIGSDRILAWVAAYLGIRLPFVKDVIRKSCSLGRLVRAHVLDGHSTRISDGFASPPKGKA
jgi:glycosyltransferase involved in cell wall biosynthesis